MGGPIARFAAVVMAFTRHGIRPRLRKAKTLVSASLALATLSATERGITMLVAMAKRHIGGQYYLETSPLAHTPCAGWYFTSPWFGHRKVATAVGETQGVAYMDVTMFSSRCSPGVQEVARDMRRSWHELVCESGAPLRLIFDSLKLVLDLDVINFIADGE